VRPVTWPGSWRRPGGSPRRPGSGWPAACRPGRPAGSPRHDADARPIAKGSLGKPVQFGYKGQVTDNDDGIVPGHALEQGNPADAPQLAPAIERVIKRTDRKPRTVTADRGYGEKAVDDALHDMGVRTVVIRARADPAKTARPPSTGPRSGAPSGGGPAAKDGSAPSNAGTGGTAHARTASKEPGSGPATASWHTTWSRSRPWPPDPDRQPARHQSAPCQNRPPTSALRVFQVEVARSAVLGRWIIEASESPWSPWSYWADR
jgi:Transposase DDE domain